MAGGYTPEDLLATPSSNTTISLTWNNTSNSLDIKVFRKAEGGVYGLVYNVPAGEVDYTNGGLSQSTHYYYKLQYDTQSTYSNESDTWTYPTAPSGLAVSFVGTTATLTWTNNGTYTHIYYQKKKSSDSTWDTAVAVTGTLSTTDVAVTTENESYDFRIRAYRSDSALYSSYNTVTGTYSGLLAPTGLSAACPTTTTCNLAWTDNSAVEDGYQIFRDDILINEHVTAEKVNDGGMEVWITDHSMFSWTVAVSGTSTVNKEVTAPHSGTYCARLDIDASNNPADITQSFRLRRNLDHTLSLWYKTEAVKTSKIQLYDTTGNIWLDGNGDWQTSEQSISLPASTSWLNKTISFKSDNTYITDVVTNGDMETWLSATNLDGWTETVSGTSTVNRESTDPHAGTYCARLDVDSSNSAVSISQAETLITGRRYTLSFWYKTEAGKTGKLTVSDSTGTVYLDANGKFTTTSGYITLPETTDWKNFRISVLPYGSYTAYNVFLGNDSATSSSIYFDYVTMYLEDYFYTIKLTNDSASSSSLWWDDVSVKATNAGEYSDDNLNNGTDYTYKVRACKGTTWYTQPIGFSLFATTSVTTGSLPDAIPLFTSVVPNSNKTITVNWVDTATNATAFYVYRSTDDIIYTELGSVLPAVQTYVDTPPATPTKYYYKVKAYNDSGYSDPASATVDPGLEAWDSATSPTSWTATINGTSTVNKETSIVHSGSYSCRLDIDSSNSVASIDQTITLVAGKGYVASVWYRTTSGASALMRIYDASSNVWLDSSSEWQTSSQDISLVASSAWTNYKIDFPAHASYTSYKIYISNDAATSQSIAIDDVNVYGYGTSVADLDPPTNIVATVISATQIKLDFTNNSPDADTLNVETKVYGGSYSAVTTGGDAITYTKGSLTEGLTYMFRIRASVTVDAVTTYGDYSSVVTIPLIYSDVGTIQTNETYIGMGNILAVATTEPTNAMDCFMITKPFSFEDKDSDMDGKWSMTDRVHFDFVDMYADTPVTIHISNDGGVTWEQSVTLLLGTGDGKHKCFDFWYFPVHGQKHTFKIESNDTDTAFFWTGFDIYYEPTSRLFEMGPAGTS